MSALNRSKLSAVVGGFVMLAVALMLGLHTSTVALDADTVACGSFFAGPSDQALQLTEKLPAAANGTQTDVVAMCTPVLELQTFTVWVLFGAGLALAGFGAATWPSRPAAPQPPPVYPYPPWRP